MKKIVAILSAGCIIVTIPVLGDHLKDSLSGMLKKKDEIPAMVNLDILSATQPVKAKSRSPKTVIATVNHIDIIKKDVDTYLQQRTKGEVTDFDLLSKEQRLVLIKEISLSLLLEEGAQKALSDQEKDAVLSSVWIMQKTQDANITDAQIKVVYEELKVQAKAQGAIQQVSPFEAVKERIKIQIVTQKIASDLMEGAKVRIVQDAGNIAGYVGMITISIDEANKVLQTMTQGKMNWKTISTTEKMQLLQAIAPSKFIALAAKNSLSEKEQKSVLANYWTQKRLSQISVSDMEVKKRYEEIKKIQKGTKLEKELLNYTTLKKSLKIQIANEKFIEGLLKQAKIKLK
ncbi:MAG: hypothetical protein LGB68_05010 [Sulfurovum sp.]|nr:hypothetical protein [Sulfurovum sp.]